MSTFKIGQTVTWTSSSNGSTTTKTGFVEVVIPTKGRIPYEHKSELSGVGMPRDHESYLVRVPAKTARGKGKLYWPIASKLKAA